MKLSSWALLGVAVVAVAGIGAAAWLRDARQALPDGIAAGNGRLEAQEIDIATKFAGRLQDVMVDEGDTVAAGQVLAVIDMRDLDATARSAGARIRQAEQARAAAAALVDQRESELAYARQEYDRAITLLIGGHVSEELIDQRQTAREAAEAALASARAQHADADAAIAAATAELERVEADLSEGVLTAPRAGRVQYRLAEPGEVLAAGGKVLTIIDLEDMHMTFFLPEQAAGRASIGAEARIVLDGLADQPIAARISFVAAEAQFTPRHVETADEREKLVFRVKAEVVESLDSRLKPGMPGMAYVRLDAETPWPAALAGASQ